LGCDRGMCFVAESRAQLFLPQAEYGQFAPNHARSTRPQGQQRGHSHGLQLSWYAYMCMSLFSRPVFLFSCLTSPRTVCLLRAPSSCRCDVARCADFAIRVSGGGDRWFTAPMDDSFFNIKFFAPQQHSLDDVEIMGGESVINEAAGKRTNERTQKFVCFVSLSGLSLPPPPRLIHSFLVSVRVVWCDVVSAQVWEGCLKPQRRVCCPTDRTAISMKR
jgi:hypothetical protein